MGRLLFLCLLLLLVICLFGESLRLLQHTWVDDGGVGSLPDVCWNYIYTNIVEHVVHRNQRTHERRRSWLRITSLDRQNY